MFNNDLAYYKTHILSPPSTAWKIALRPLADLKAAGDNDSGRLFVVLCGSSSVLHLLVTLVQGDKSKLVTERYPLASQAPGLNGTKYHKIAIDSPLPVDLDSVRAIVRTSHPDANDGLALFIHGSGRLERERRLQVSPLTRRPVLRRARLGTRPSTARLDSTRLLVRAASSCKSSTSSSAARTRSSSTG